MAGCGKKWTRTSFMGTLKHTCKTEGEHKACFCGTCGDPEHRAMDADLREQEED